MKLVVSALLLCLCSIPAAMAVTYSDSETEQTWVERELAKQEQNIAKTKADLMGKTWWYEPVSKPYGVRFLVALPVPGNSDPRAFRPLQKTTFTVTDVIKRQRQFHPLNEFFVEVTWEDGRKGYVATKRDGINPFDIYGPLVYSTMYNEIIYEKDPDIIRAEEAKAKAREEQKRVAAAKAWKARGGVRVGMTKADVLNSNWGRPNSVNKTTTKNGTYEQWVYDGGYLYFDNGVVISIQN